MTGLTVLVDDTRSFADGRPARVARSSVGAVRLLEPLWAVRIDDLWLDHDLGGEDTVWPVVRLFEDAFLRQVPYEIGLVHVQASRAGPAHRIGVSMRRIGLSVERSFDLRVWTRSGEDAAALQSPAVIGLDEDRGVTTSADGDLQEQPRAGLVDLPGYRQELGR